VKRWFLVFAVVIVLAGFGVVQAQSPPPTLDIIGHVGGAIEAVATDGDYLYVGQGPRILVYDLANPEDPTKIAQTDILDSNVRMLEVVGDYVYAFFSNGNLIPNQFIVVDVSSPSAPECLGAIPMPSEYYWGTADMHIAGDYAYITGEGSTRILDVSDPADPQDIGVYPAGGSVTLLEENRLLVGMTILDVSDPEMPLYLGLLDAPDSGHYSYQGKELTTLNEEAGARFRRDHIGFIFQSFHLIPRLTALENVAMPLMLMGVPPGDRKQRAVDILVQLGLEDRAHHRPDQLSGGQQQRVAIARAAVLSPTLLLADEPTGNLDTTSGEEVMKVLEKLNGGGMTLVMVTHDSRLGKRANRRLFMEDGRITRDQ